MTPKRSLGRSEILWVVSATIFLLVARCLSHEAEPHTIGSNGFRKRTHAAFGLRGAISHTSGEGWIRGDRIWRGLCYSPLLSFLLGSRGHSECAVGTQVAAPLGVPQLCSCEAMFHLLGSVGDIAILLGSLWGHSGVCSVEAALSTEPNRLNARKRLLVFSSG